MARALFYQPDGQALPVGALLRNPDLAETLRRIATEGADAFYRGPVAEAIVAAVRGHPTNPGDMTDADLANYHAAVRPAVCGDRQSVVSGKSVSVRVDLRGRRIINTKKQVN